eukprot:CAMPEP_0176279082 /NCGR_PEP_ID=MMETSP0121_2-20121125/49107_1 /TAXON_ID=160619 /ORGANISM="Kryptoperidinium foliaceum, Strain CCMP 1326" /LENGTH=509 /DNA_ID=CAMNT_0017619397 /DNA_START=68 /DNA_END=1592 /DNA_ORIENTATION=-
MRKEPKAQPAGVMTTLLFRNLPRRYTADDLLREVESVAGAGVMDFVHVPSESALRNKAFGVVNFASPNVAHAALEALQGRRWREAARAQPAKVMVADVQGLAANLVRAAVAPGSSPPLVFIDGRSVDFSEAQRIVGVGATKGQAAAFVRQRPEAQQPPHDRKPQPKPQPKQQQAQQAQTPKHRQQPVAQQPQQLRQRTESHQREPWTPPTAKERDSVPRHGQPSPPEPQPELTKSQPHQDPESPRSAQQRQKREVHELRRLQWLLRLRLQQLSQHRRPHWWGALPDGNLEEVTGRAAWEAACARGHGRAATPAAEEPDDASSVSTEAGEEAEPAGQPGPPATAALPEAVPGTRRGAGHRGEARRGLHRNPGYRRAWEDFQARLKEFIGRYCATGVAVATAAAAAEVAGRRLALCKGQGGHAKDPGRPDADAGAPTRRRDRRPPPLPAARTGQHAEPGVKVRAQLGAASRTARGREVRGPRTPSPLPLPPRRRAERPAGRAGQSGSERRT